MTRNAYALSVGSIGSFASILLIRSAASVLAVVFWRAIVDGRHPGGSVGAT